MKAKSWPEKDVEGLKKWSIFQKEQSGIKFPLCFSYGI